MIIYYFIHTSNHEIFQKIYPLFKDKKYVIINTTYDLKLEENHIILKSPDNGMDIGGLLRCVKYCIDNNINPEYVAHIHTKTIDSWRNELLEPIIDIENTISYMTEHNLNLFGTNKWYQRWLNHEHPNYDTTLNILTRLGFDKNNIQIKENTSAIMISDMINYNKKFKDYVYNKLELVKLKNTKIRKLRNSKIISNYYNSDKEICNSMIKIYNKEQFITDFCFVGGNMYVFKWDKLPLLLKNKINEFIDELPYGRSSDAGIYLTGDESSIPHGWERAMQIIINKN
jgi:hypothetical protein